MSKILGSLKIMRYLLVLEAIFLFLIILIFIKQGFDISYYTIDVLRLFYACLIALFAFLYLIGVNYYYYFSSVLDEFHETFRINYSKENDLVVEVIKDKKNLYYMHNNKQILLRKHSFINNIYLIKNEIKDYILKEIQYKHIKPLNTNFFYSTFDTSNLSIKNPVIIVKDKDATVLKVYNIYHEDKFKAKIKKFYIDD